MVHVTVLTVRKTYSLNKILKLTIDILFNNLQNTTSARLFECSLSLAGTGRKAWETRGMAPFAFCTNPKCRRVFDFCESCNKADQTCRDLLASCETCNRMEGSLSIVPPSECPDCYAHVVAWCPRCKGSIANKPEGDEPKCAYCGRELLGPAKAKPSKAASGAAKAAGVGVLCFKLADSWLADVIRNVMQ